MTDKVRMGCTVVLQFLEGKRGQENPYMSCMELETSDM